MPILAELLEILQLNNNQHCVSTRPVIELTTTTQQHNSFRLACIATNRLIRYPLPKPADSTRHSQQLGGTQPQLGLEVSEKAGRLLGSLHMHELHIAYRIEGAMWQHVYHNNNVQNTQT
jgi:hypothetical protein